MKEIINIIEPPKTVVDIKSTPPISTSVIDNAKVINFGTNNYDKLTNKPQINAVTLQGNKTLEELDIQPKGDYPDSRVTNLEIDSLF